MPANHRDISGRGTPSNKFHEPKLLASARFFSSRFEPTTPFTSVAMKANNEASIPTPALTRGPPLTEP